MEKKVFKTGFSPTVNEVLRRRNIILFMLQNSFYTKDHNIK